jgi:capsid protein
VKIVSHLQALARSALGIRSAPPPAIVQTASEAMRGRWGRWDSKVTDRMNQAHWGKVTGLPINAELAYANNWLRAQAEYEISTNSVFEGMVRTFSTDVVGPEGPHYRVTSSDPDYNIRRETIWRDWARHAGANRQLSLVEILNTWVGALWKAGEFGTQMIYDAAAPGPVTMRLLPVHMHRLMTPPEMLGDPDVALGVRRDANRNPISYYVSEPYLFGPFEVYTGVFYRIPYRDFIHGYRLDEEDQVRGVPWLASALDRAGQIRDWDKAMLDAAEMIAKTGVLWQLKNPDAGAPVQVQSGTSSPMQRGVHTFGPPGYEASELTPTQPSSDQQSWRAEIKAEMGRGVNMPAMILNLDSSKHSYSSARFDNQPYWRFVGGVQGWLARIGLDRMEETVIREAEIAGELEEAPADVQHSWGWIKPPQVDPTKEQIAERGYLQDGTIAWSDAVIARGEIPERVLETRKRDAKRLAAAGLPAIPGIPDPSKAAGAGASAGPVKDPQAARTWDEGRLREASEDGHWVTIDGNHVFIKEGTSEESATAQAKSGQAENASGVAAKTGSKMHHEIAAAVHREAVAKHYFAAEAAHRAGNAKLAASHEAIGHEHQKKAWSHDDAAKRAEKVSLEPSKSHTIALPKNPKRLTIDQADQAMAQMGYKVGGSHYDAQKGTSYTLTTPDGRSKTMSADEIKKMVYAGAKLPGQVGAAKRQPSERSADPSQRVRQPAEESAG